MPVWQIALETLTEEVHELRQIIACNREIIRAALHALHLEIRREQAVHRQKRQVVDEYRSFRERILEASLPGDDA